MSAVQQSYFAHLTLFDYLGMVLTGALNGLGGIQFFRLRRNAVHLLLLVPILNILLTLRAALTTNWLEVGGANGLGVLLSFALALEVLLYAVD